MESEAHDFELQRQRLLNLFKAAHDGSWPQVDEAHTQLGGGPLEKFRDAEGRTVAHFASSSSNVNVIRNLPNRSSLLDAVDNEGETALHIAARRGNCEVVVLLLEKSANPNIRNGRGCVPLHLALTGKEAEAKEVVESLLAKGAEIDVCSSHLGTPLQAAICQEFMSIAKALLENGANPSLFPPNKIIPPPIILASSLGHEGIVMKLIDAGVDPNTSSDDKGWGPLYCAAERGDLKCVQLLVKAGADIQTVNLGLSALDAAKHAGHDEVAQFLEGLGCKGGGGDPSTQMKESANDVKANGSSHDDPWDGLPKRSPISPVERREAEKLKEMGNDLVKQQLWAEAIAAYKDALDICRGDGSENSRCLGAILLSNISYVHVKGKQFRQAIETAEKAIKLNSKWPKGYVRLAYAYDAIGDFSEAAQQAYAAWMQDTSNMDNRKLFKHLLTKAQKKHQEEQRQTS